VEANGPGRGNAPKVKLAGRLPNGRPRFLEQDDDCRYRLLAAANILVKRHGKDAALVASQRIDELLAAGDLEGRAVWFLILKAVSELQRDKPTEGEQVN